MRLLCSLFSYIFTWSSFHPRLSWSSNRVTWNEPMDMHKGGISDGESKEPLGQMDLAIGTSTVMRGFDR